MKSCLEWLETLGDDPDLVAIPELKHEPAVDLVADRLIADVAFAKAYCPACEAEVSGRPVRPRCLAIRRSRPSRPRGPDDLPRRAHGPRPDRGDRRALTSNRPAVERPRFRPA